MLSQPFRQEPCATALFGSPAVFSQPDEDCVLSDAMEKLGTFISVGRNQEIYSEQEPAHYLYKIVSGVVRTCKFLIDGRRQIGSFHFSGDTFGFTSGMTHGLSAEAVKSCKLIAVRRTILTAAAGRDAELATALWNAATEELQRAQEHMVLLGRTTAAERITAFLQGLAGGRFVSDAFDIPMSRQDIADYLGLTIETVSRTITLLEQTGFLALESARRLQLRTAA